MAAPGDMLRLARESLGVPLDEVARQTHIRPEYLEAIEQNNYAALPGDVFTRGFLRNYSNAVGVDSNAVIAAYEGRNDAPRKRIIGPAAPPPRRPPEPVRIQPLSPTQINMRVRYAPSFWLMGLLAFVLLILGYLGYNTLTGIRDAPSQATTATAPAQTSPTTLAFLPSVVVSNTPLLTPFPTPGSPGPTAIPTHPLPSSVPQLPPILATGTPPAGGAPATQAPGATPATPAPGELATAVPGATADAQTTLTPPGNGVAVQVTVGSQNAWMKVDVDGKTVFAATLAAGSNRTWTGLSRIRIRFARADITSVNVNGVDKGIVGDPSTTIITKEWDSAGTEHIIP